MPTFIGVWYSLLRRNLFERPMLPSADHETIACARCGEPLRVPWAWRGSSVKCASCGGSSPFVARDRHVELEDPFATEAPSLAVRESVKVTRYQLERQRMRTRAGEVARLVARIAIALTLAAGAVAVGMVVAG
jgi:hypothetical protein